jgi:phosphate transport system protein
MTTTVTSADSVYQSVLVNYLVSMARAVEKSIHKSLDSLLTRGEKLASQVFLTEPRINEMEMIIDEHALSLLKQQSLADEELRLIVATIKINNDLERMGDLAVNIAERVLSLSSLEQVDNPVELEPMATAVRAMVSKSLGALIFRNVDLATEVLESDDIVDSYRDRIFEGLLTEMTQNPHRVNPILHLVLATRHLERIADHSTNIAEDILFWLRGWDVRHGRHAQASDKEL